MVKQCPDSQRSNKGIGRGIDLLAYRLGGALLIGFGAVNGGYAD